MSEEKKEETTKEFTERVQSEPSLTTKIEGGAVRHTYSSRDLPSHSDHKPTFRESFGNRLAIGHSQRELHQREKDERQIAKLESDIEANRNKVRRKQLVTTRKEQIAVLKGKKKSTRTTRFGFDSRGLYGKPKKKRTRKRKRQSPRTRSNAAMLLKIRKLQRQNKNLKDKLDKM